MRYSAGPDDSGTVKALGTLSVIYLQLTMMLLDLSVWLIAALRLAERFN